MDDGTIFNLPLIHNGKVIGTAKFDSLKLTIEAEIDRSKASATDIVHLFWWNPSERVSIDKRLD